MKLNFLIRTSALVVPFLLGQASGASLQAVAVRNIVGSASVSVDTKSVGRGATFGPGRTIATGEAKAEVLFDQRAIGLLGKNTEVQIEAQCIRLLKGRLLINGTQRVCVGDQVLAARGTTLAMARLEDETYNVSVLNGEAEIGRAEQVALDRDVDILSLYPSFNPSLGVAAMAYGSNSGGTVLGQASGLIQGGVNALIPLYQKDSQKLVYNYTATNSNFNRYWGVSTEFGYRWFSPSNASSKGIFVGYDGFSAPNCYHNNVAVGAEYLINRWQIGVNGSIRTDACIDSISTTTLNVGIPVAQIGANTLTLNLSPYLLTAIGSDFGGGRVGVYVPVTDQLSFNVYGQYDSIFDTVVGGMINYRFGVGRGGFVRDPNRAGSQVASTKVSGLPSGDGSRMSSSGRGRDVLLASSSLPFSISTVTDAPSSLAQAGSPVVVKAGSEAVLASSGSVSSVAAMNQQRFQDVAIANLAGQNLLPESLAIYSTARSLYGSVSSQLLAVTGSGWVRAAVTPVPRLRSDQGPNVVPASKLPHESYPSWSSSSSSSSTSSCPTGYVDASVWNGLVSSSGVSFPAGCYQSPSTVGTNQLCGISYPSGYYYPCPTSSELSDPVLNQAYNQQKNLHDYNFVLSTRI